MTAHVRERAGDDARSGIEAIIAATSVAVVGSATRAGPARKVVDNLRHVGFAGSVSLVNRSGQGAGGHPTYRSLHDLPDAPDVVVVAVNSAATVPVVADAAEIGARGAVILASGFGETGADGERLAAQVLARRSRLRIIGPNCLGFLSLPDQVAAYSGPLPEPLLAGPVALLSNSGAMACTLTGAAAERRLRCSHIITCGNQLDLQTADFVRYLVGREEVGAIGCYLEGFTDGRALLAAFDTAAEAGKPVVVLKAGRSRAGGEAAKTHTGALAGLSLVQSDLFRQHGVCWASDPEEFLALLELTARAPRLRSGVRFGVVTISGGERLLVADALEEAGLRLAPLEPSTEQQLRGVLPAYATAANPLDTTGAGIVEGNPEVHGRAAQILAADPNVDVLLACQDAKNGWLQAELANDIFVDAVACARKAAEQADKTLVIVSPTTGQVDERARDLLERYEIPLLMGLHPAMAALREYTATGVSLHGERPLPPTGGHRTTRPEVAGRRMEVVDVVKLLADQGIPHWPTSYVADASEAVAAAGAFGYPVALKLESRIAHRRVMGGVRLGLADAASVATAWRDLVQVAEAHSAQGDSMSIQPMAFGATELFIGGTQDPQFGPILLVGPGGSDVEGSEAIAIGLAPLGRHEAQTLVEHALSRSSALAQGVLPSALEATVDAVERAAALIAAPAIIALDINPLLVFADRVSVLDAKVVHAE
jgi:acyl-CoA synthetase (NDP forming)